MESGKPMETPPEGSWRKEDVTSDEVVEATIYRQRVGSLMYLVKTQPTCVMQLTSLIKKWLIQTNYIGRHPNMSSDTLEAPLNFLFGTGK